MIKRIEIYNYGPFKTVEKNKPVSVEFNESLRPTYIVGLNDAGKTVMFSALISSSDKKKGLEKKYCSDNEKNHSHVKLFFKIKLSNALEKIFEDLKKIVGKKFEEKVDKISDELFEVETFPGKSITPDEKLEVIKKNVLISELLNIVFKKINNFTTEPVIGFHNFSETRIKELISEYSNYEISDYFKILQKFQVEIYNIFFGSIFFLSAIPNSYFNFIKPSYRIRENSGLSSELDEFKEIIKPFISSEHLEKFEKIIEDDEMSEDDRRRKMLDVEDAFEENVMSDFNKYFVPQNYGLKFNFRLNYKENKISFHAKEPATEDFHELSTCSDGLKWFLKLFIILRNAKPNQTIIIDEPEKFLHISIQKQLSKTLIKECKERNVQVIFITHSPFMLPHMNNEELINDIKIIIKQKSSSIVLDKNVGMSTKNLKDEKEKVKVKALMLVLADAMGINIETLLKHRGVKKILLVKKVEYAYMIKCAGILAGKTSFNELWIIPIRGHKKTNVMDMLNVLTLEEIDIKALLKNDKEKKSGFLENQTAGMNRFFRKKIEVFSLIEIANDKNITSPEDLLEKNTWNKINNLLKNGKKPTNVDKWKMILKSLSHNNSAATRNIITDNDKKKLKEFWEQLEKKHLVL